MNIDEWEIVIGCEVHCQLATQSKIFSPAPTSFGDSPNSKVATVDLGLPGVLPVINQRVVEFALRTGLALGCRINQRNVFARKNYFYPDLPKGYQISQADIPICEGGELSFLVNDEIKKVELTRIHMEEDAGKSSHISGKPFSLIDLNRAGTPLIEIVSEPDMRSADEVVAYLKELRSIVIYLGVCTGNMEEGAFRCDANVSVRKKGDSKLGTRCELKNINSFKFIKDAINYEAFRQIELIENGGEVGQETRLYNPERGVTFTMRTKEDSHDYRYFPDPDLPPIIIRDDVLEEAHRNLPELPAQKRERYEQILGLSAYDAALLAVDVSIALYFDTCMEISKNSKLTANWIINELMRETNAAEISTFVITPARLMGLIQLLDEDVINGKIAKKVFGKMLTQEESAAEIVENEGLKQVTDTAAIESVIDDLINENPEKVLQFKEKPKMKGWFVGQVMKAMKGKANPKIVNELLEKKLNA